MLTLSFKHLPQVLKVIRNFELSGVLIGQNDNTPAALVFQDGQITHAQHEIGVQKEEGDPALYSLLAWRGGHVSWKPGGVNIDATIDEDQARTFFETVEFLTGTGSFEQDTLDYTLFNDFFSVSFFKTDASLAEEEAARPPVTPPPSNPYQNQPPNGKANPRLGDLPDDNTPYVRPGTTTTLANGNGRPRPGTTTTLANGNGNATPPPRPGTNSLPTNGNAPQAQRSGAGDLEQPRRGTNNLAQEAAIERGGTARLNPNEVLINRQGTATLRPDAIEGEIVGSPEGETALARRGTDGLRMRPSTGELAPVPKEGPAIATLIRMGVPRLAATKRYSLNSHFANSLEAARQVAGNNWTDIVQTAHLLQYISMPADNDEAYTTPVDYLSRLNYSFEKVFGSNAPEKIREWGRVGTERSLQGRGGPGQELFRLIPGKGRKLTMMLNTFAKTMDKVRGEQLHTWKQIDQHQHWIVHYNNLYALGRRTPINACYVWTASYEALLRWAGLANDYYVEEVECGCVTGTWDCVFTIRSA
jgi:Domain of unknown function (DUF4388)